MPRLTIHEQGKEESLIHECTQDSITIGRLDKNVITLPGEGVSRQHARIFIEGSNFFLIDLKSGNGTLLNGVPVKSNEKKLLKSGDKISIDTFDLTFHDNVALKASFTDEVTESDILEVKLLKKVITALDKDMVPSIEVLNGTAEGKKVFFTDEMNEMIIGRDPECDFPINEYVISRRHAKVLKRWGGIILRDLESKNGTFLNNRRVVEEYLHDGDRIALGTIVLMFRNPSEINLAHLEQLKPKNKPAQIKPSEIPGLEKEATAEEEVGSEAPPAPEEAGENEEPSPMEEWDRLEEKSQPKIEPYPTPTPRKRLLKRMTPIEIGLIGLGVLVIIVALIAVVNLMAS